jgi:RNA polymerase sigma-70 factor (ECF subfamily)
MKEASAPESTGFDPVRLIESHQAGLWRYLRALGCEPELADDLTQDTFLVVLQKPFEEINEAATGTYLRKVAFNLFVTYQRRAGRVTLMENIEELSATWEQLAGDDSGEALLEALRECLKGLSERARWALEMRFRDHRARADIATALEITEHGAKNLMARAKTQLKTCIEGKLLEKLE